MKAFVYLMLAVPMTGMGVAVPEPQGVPYFIMAGLAGTCCAIVSIGNLCSQAARKRVGKLPKRRNQ